METRGKKLRFWLKIGRAYRKVMIPTLCVLGVTLLALSVLGLRVHIAVALVAYTTALVLAYIPRLLLRCIKSGYAEMLGADDAKIVLFGTMGQAQESGHMVRNAAQNALALDQQLASETHDLQGFWPTKMGRETKQ